MTYSAEVLADTPWLYWPMQDAGGATTIADTSGNSRPGDVIGSPTAGSLVRVGGPTTATFSQSFDNTVPEYISYTATQFPIGNYTVEGWVYVPTGTITTATSLFGLCASLTGSPNGMIYLETDATLRWYHRQYGSITWNLPSLARGYWHHLVATTGSTYGGSHLYVNGQLTYAFGTADGQNYGGEFPFIRAGNWNGYTASRISQVAFYNLELSPARVLAHYNAMGTIDNPAVNTTTRAQVWTQSVEIAVRNTPRAQVWTQSVEIAIKNIPPARVWTQSVDIAVRQVAVGGFLDSANVITLTSFPGEAGPIQPASAAGPTAVINMSAPQGAKGTLLLGTRAVIAVSAGAGDVTAFAIDRTGSGLTLTLAQTVIQGLPNALTGRITQGVPNSYAFLFLNSSVVAVTSIYLDSSGGGSAVIPLAANTPAGSNTVTATMTSDRTGVSSSASFTVTGTSVVDVVPTPYVPVRDVVTQWTFRDYVDSSISYTFPINPESFEATQADAPVGDMFTASPAGKRIYFQGAASPPVWSFSGRTLTEAHTRAMETWSRKRQRIYLTDHFNRRLVIKFESFNMSQVRDNERPWHHKYDAKIRVLSLEEPT